MAPLPRPKLLPHILDLHLEQLAWMLERRQNALFAPDWTLAELHELEERAAAHLDGLVIAGGHAVDLVQPLLAGGEASEVMAAALVLLALDEPSLRDEVLGALAKAEADEVRDGLRLALRHARLADLLPALLELSAGDDLAAAAAAADVLAFQRSEPREPARLVTADDAHTREIAYGVLGRLQQVGSRWLDAVLGDPDPAVVRAGLQAAARSGATGIDVACRKAAQQDDGAASTEALRFLGVVGARSDRALLESAAREKGARSLAALEALGALGDVASVPALLECMADAELADAAAAAFQRITGIDEIPVAEPEAADAQEADAEADVDAEFEADKPSPEALASWWQQNATRFAPETTWQAGLNTSNPAAVLDRLPLASRRDVYLAARVRTPSEVPDLELEATGRPGAFGAPRPVG